MSPAVPAHSNGLSRTASVRKITGYDVTVVARGETSLQGRVQCPPDFVVDGYETSVETGSLQEYTAHDTNLH